MKLRSLIIALCMSALLPASMQAGRTMLSAKLDSATMLMGTVNTLRLEVVQDKGVKGEFPLLRGFGERGYVTLLNDTIELRSDIKVDTTEVGSGRIQIDYHVPVQVFDSGYYRLPEFVYVAGRDSVRSSQLVLTVRPVNVKADDPISPLTDPADPENPSIFDSLPDWLVYYWWVILLVLLLAAGGWWAWRRYRRQGSILPAKPEPPAYEVALGRLQRLKSRKLWESGQEKEFYTILTDILRDYLDRRFGIKAMEMTSSQIMDTLAVDRTLREMRDPRQMMRQILDMADFVKFAMVRPMPEDNVKAFDNAVAFVEATRPVDKPADGDQDGEDGDSADATARSASGADTKDRAGSKAGAGRKGGEA
ncbi:MAG: hypothetical protein K2H21_00990 [Muribaculaceae bacterium]|nr:hypothetical protein [Muribaculaceae bacterium]